MPTNEELFDSFLSDVAVELPNTNSYPIGITEENTELDFPQSGEVDYRIRQLSYSSILSLHSCPRKFQLYKLRSSGRSEEAPKSTITFAYGHIVGEGIQYVLQGLPKEEVIWRMFLGWHTDLFAEDEKMKKSFWSAVIAIERFIHIRDSELLNEYELLYYEGKPATELSFAVSFPDGFRLRGFVDAVLRNRITGEIVVLECKTTGSATLNPAQFKNSAQGIGYSIVLDVLAPEISSYKVIYLVYQTKGQEYTILEFPKSYLQRALWIKELLLDIETIKMYDREGVYPMHGESCYSFFRECEYFNVCTLSTKHLTKPFNPATDTDVLEYQVNVTLLDLIESQVRKVTGITDGEALRDIAGTGTTDEIL